LLKYKFHYFEASLIFLFGLGFTAAAGSGSSIGTSAGSTDSALLGDYFLIFLRLSCFTFSGPSWTATSYSCSFSFFSSI